MILLLCLGNLPAYVIQKIGIICSVAGAEQREKEWS